MNSFEGRLSSLEEGMASINNRTNQLKSIYSSALLHLHSEPPEACNDLCFGVQTSTTRSLRCSTCLTS